MIVVQSGAAMVGVRNEEEFGWKGRAMRIGRWLTWIGSIVSLLTGIGHGAKFSQLQGMIAASSVKPPLDGIVRACWLAFSGQMVATAVIAMVAGRTERGGQIVLLCAASTILNSALLLHFLGPFIGVYISAAVAVLFFVGGWMQTRQKA